MISKHSINKLGFTMIELLVVIAVIGILAAAVLAAINPIEQINKGRDTRTRADITSLVQASERYFVLQETYPWNNDSLDGSSWTGEGDPDDVLRYGYSYLGAEYATGNLDWVQVLVDVDEVKDGFADRINDVTNGFFIYKVAGGNETLYGCFIPQSEAFKRQAADECNGGAPIPAVNTCITTDGTVNAANYICIP